jgi:hypothetical protein
MTMIIDGTNGLTFNNATTQASAGQVLQVVNAYDQSFTTSTSRTYVDTNLSLSITPKFSTSKILVVANIMGGCNSGRGIALRLTRAGTQILVFMDGGGSIGTAYNTYNLIAGMPITYLDSPATTSATTYKIQYCAPISGTAYVGFYDTVQATTSTITLMEIAA